MGRFTSQVSLSYSPLGADAERALIPDSGVSVAVEFWNGAN